MTTEKTTAAPKTAPATTAEAADVAAADAATAPEPSSSAQTDTAETVASDGQANLSGKDARAKDSATDLTTIASSDLKEAAKQFQIDNQLRFKTLGKSNATGTATTVAAKTTGNSQPATAETLRKGKQVADSAGNSGYAYAGKPPGFTGASAVDEGVSAAGVALAGGAGVLATAIDSYTSLGAAHADAHKENRYRGRVDGNAAGYANRLHGEERDERKVRHKVEDAKANTYWRSYNESVGRGYDDASKKTDVERTAARSYFDREAEAAGDGHLVGDVLVTGREVKREILRHAYAAD